MSLDFIEEETVSTISVAGCDDVTGPELVVEAVPDTGLKLTMSAASSGEVQEQKMSDSDTDSNYVPSQELGESKLCTAAQGDENFDASDEDSDSLDEDSDDSMMSEPEQNSNNSDSEKKDEQDEQQSKCPYATHPATQDLICTCSHLSSLFKGSTPWCLDFLHDSNIKFLKRLYKSQLHDRREFIHTILHVYGDGHLGFNFRDKNFCHTVFLHMINTSIGQDVVTTTKKEIEKANPTVA